MPRTGPRPSSIKASTYFPKKGDMLDDLSEGMSFECVRTDVYRDRVTGERIRYGLLVGRHPDWGQEAIPCSCLELERDHWLGSKEDRQAGEGIQRIRRVRTTDGKMRIYDYDRHTDTFVFTP